MTRETYEKLTGSLKKSPKLTVSLIWADRILTGSIYLAYPMLLGFLFLEKSPQLLRAFLVPFISFLAVSGFRRLYSAPRPYEVFGIKPVLPKSTKGKSFPSRHVFSIFLIATAFYYTTAGAAGIIIAAAGIGMAILRVLGGVHYPKDVIAGAILGIACGMAGFCIPI